jgi:DNA-binding IclR family transcriptional regulator
MGVIYNELRRVKALGIAQAKGTHIRGISSLSVPVFDHKGEIVFAISAIGNQMTFDARLEGPLAKELKQLASRISGFLGSKVS